MQQGLGLQYKVSAHDMHAQRLDQCSGDMHWHGRRYVGLREGLTGTVEHTSIQNHDTCQQLQRLMKGRASTPMHG